MTVRRLTTPLVVATLALGWTALVALPASASCHVAAFIEDTVEAGEGDGTVLLTVELRGRAAACAGTVDVETVDGLAKAGEDYETFAATLTFEEGDDRVETVEVALLDDAAAEEDEDFTVALSNPTGGISVTGDPATVTVRDDDAGDDVGSGDGAGSEAVGADGADDTKRPNTIAVIVVALAVIGAAALRGRRGRRRN